jgi:rhodanese-related sulfurtransferase
LDWQISLHFLSKKYNVLTNIQGNTMTTTADILTIARKRSQENQFPYAGAVTPQEAYALLQSNPKAKLIDVRTNAERDWIGKVAIPESQHSGVQWNVYPGGTPNPEFLKQLQQVADKDSVLLFLCRADVRSRQAAKLATENGYAQCFDILEGFEGSKDAEGHRKTVNGWCKAGLPWIGA